MTKTIKSLLNAKKLIENKIRLNNSLIETIQTLKQDETNLQEENEAYTVALKLIKKDLRKEYKR